MQRLAETIISLLDLAEAEGRLIQQKIIHTLVIMLVYVGAALLILAAIGFILAAIYHALALYLKTVWVFLIMGFICLLISGIAIWHIRRTDH
ncbi:MAG: hypothetical protein NMNS01_29930 [Nitrosomonas sp.]|nr:MAG: hypothetical protein NMNS01_29930 [Nitrosomonas sp.]